MILWIPYPIRDRETEKSEVRRKKMKKTREKEEKEEDKKEEKYLGSVKTEKSPTGSPEQGLAVTDSSNQMYSL